MGKHVRIESNNILYIVQYIIAFKICKMKGKITLLHADFRPILQGLMLVRQFVLKTNSIAYNTTCQPYCQLIFNCAGKL